MSDALVRIIKPLQIDYILTAYRDSVRDFKPNKNTLSKMGNAMLDATYCSVSFHTRKKIIPQPYFFNRFPEKTNVLQAFKYLECWRLSCWDCYRFGTTTGFREYVNILRDLYWGIPGFLDSWKEANWDIEEYLSKLNKLTRKVQNENK